MLCLKVSDDVHDAMSLLREFLYENVYRSPQVHGEFEKSMKILKDLYIYFMDKKNSRSFEEELDGIEMAGCAVNDPHDRRVCDFIASMTDRHALDLYSKLFLPLPMV
jgi:dGTPase